MAATCQLVPSGGCKTEFYFRAGAPTDPCAKGEVACSGAGALGQLRPQPSLASRVGLRCALHHLRVRRKQSACRVSQPVRAPGRSLCSLRVCWTACMRACGIACILCSRLARKPSMTRHRLHLRRVCRLHLRLLRHVAIRSADPLLRWCAVPPAARNLLPRDSTAKLVRPCSHQP